PLPPPRPYPPLFRSVDLGAAFAQILFVESESFTVSLELERTESEVSGDLPGPTGLRVSEGELAIGVLVVRRIGLQELDAVREMKPGLLESLVGYGDRVRLRGRLSEGGPPAQNEERNEQGRTRRRTGEERKHDLGLYSRPTKIWPGRWQASGLFAPRWRGNHGRERRGWKISLLRGKAGPLEPRSSPQSRSKELAVKCKGYDRNSP